MRLRIAKGIAFARTCEHHCRHDWQQIEKAVAIVRRAIRRGSRLVSRATRGYEFWKEADKS